jgi:hypothetical protein
LKTADGTSALGLAVKNNKPAIVRHLLACGATYDRNERILKDAMYCGHNQHDLVFEIISSLHKEEVNVCQGILANTSTFTSTVTLSWLWFSSGTAQEWITSEPC